MGNDPFYHVRNIPDVCCTSFASFNKFLEGRYEGYRLGPSIEAGEIVLEIGTNPPYAAVGIYERGAPPSLSLEDALAKHEELMQLNDPVMRQLFPQMPKLGVPR